MNLASLTELIAAQFKPAREAHGAAILAALQSKPNMYAGTVPYATIQKRRAANRVARKSRATNRRTK